MRIVNCTPHAVVVHREGSREPLVFQPSGVVPRLKETRRVMLEVPEDGLDGFAGLRIYETWLDAAEDLPPPASDTFLIVSALVRTALPERQDLLSPGEPVRDAEGRVVGCKGLISNPWDFA
jgi:hypothetical protein